MRTSRLPTIVLNPSSALRALRLWLALTLWMLAVALPLPGHAADSGPAARPSAAAASASGSPSSSGMENAEPELPHPDALRKQLDAIPAKLGENEDIRKLQAQVSAIGAAADQLAKRRAEDLADIDSRLAGLGPAPEKGAPADTPDVARQRAALDKQRSTVDSALKLARLIIVDAEQRSADLARQRRAQFQAELTARVESPLSPTFWRNWKDAAATDWFLLQQMGNELQRVAAATLASKGGKAYLLAHLLGALAVIVLGTWIAERILLRILPRRLPAGRLRRTALASAAIAINVLIVGIGVSLAWEGLQRGGPLPEDLSELATATIGLTAYGAFVVSLGHVLLSSKRPTWRLLPISNALARRLRAFPWWFALCTGLGGLMTEIIGLVGWSLVSEVAVNALFAVVAALLVLAALRRLRNSAVDSQAAGAYTGTGTGTEAGSPESAADTASTPEPGTTRPFWFGLLAAASGLAAIAILVATASGFVALASTMAKQLVWCIVVLSTVYLLLKLTDDLCDALLSSRGAFGAKLHASFGIEERLLDQLSVLTSGLLRVALFFYTVIALMAPLGTSPDEVFRRGTTVNRSLSIGDFTIDPEALLTAAMVICGGFIALQLFKRWLTNRYFPNTSLEPGMRSSITTLTGSLGGVVVVAAALAGLGISVERIAWVASALSVGIGFGLQAIVQNFISGLILLAERPVKVGDWVILGDTEGDVRRVNVRATEIQLPDRSTMIVPNSEFITKAVRNMTQAGAPGRVLMRLPAPLDTDAPRVREIILHAYTSHPNILESPSPIVQLEGITNGTLTFLAIGYIGSPRNTGGVRSELLFNILEALREAGLHLSPPATISVAQPQAQPPGSGNPVVDQLTGARSA